MCIFSELSFIATYIYSNNDITVLVFAHMLYYNILLQLTTLFIKIIFADFIIKGDKGFAPQAVSCNSIFIDLPI